MNPGEQIGKYTIKERLGGGAFGEVYLAHDIALASDKAIKVLSVDNPGDVLEKLKEAQILDKCRHTNIVAINDANLYPFNNTECIVLDLEHLPGGSLESEIATRWISIKEACTRISAILAGLQFAHSKGYLHRDVKPANILIDGNSTKLSDFGLATASHDLMGSDQGYLAHCPPEFYSTKTTNVLSDIFACGITLFRVVSNITDWRCKLAATRDWQHLARTGTLLHKIGFAHHTPTRIKSIIKKACNTDSSKRYNSATALKNDLDALRYHIEWVKTASGLWVGSAGTNEFTLLAKPKRRGFEIVFQRNGRRDSSLCQVVENAEGIDSAAAGIVARTTLK